MLVRAARAAEHPIMLVTTRDAVRSTEYAVHLDELVAPNEMSLVENGNDGSAISRLRLRNQVLRRAERLCTEYPNARLVIPELSHFLMPWALRRDRRHLARSSTALLVHPAPTPAAAIRYLIRRQYSVRQTSAALVRGFILKRLRSHGLTVFDLVSSFGEDIDGGTGGEAGVGKSIAVNGHLRDPSAAAVAGAPGIRAETRAGLGLPVHEALVLVTGVIDRRKGFDLILQAFELLSRTASCPLLVVAGVVEPEFLQDSRLRDLQCVGRLWMRNEYITTSDFRSLLYSADALLVIREDDGLQSGVLAQAAACGRVVVTVGPCAVADTVRRHGLGVVAATSPEALARGIQQALADQERLEDAVKPAQKTQLDVGSQFTRALLG
jgi:glycosyltransferase involved in cell wall biosynthesis